MGDTAVKTAKMGDVVLLVVPRSTNAGLDTAPAVVTRVAKSGAVDVHALVPEGRPARLSGVKLLGSREEANKLLDFHFSDLPGGKSEYDDAGELVPVPGLNPTTGEVWHRSDVAHWVPVAYWPGDAPAVEAAPAAVESQADLIARLERELAAARGE